MNKCRYIGHLILSSILESYLISIIRWNDSVIDGVTIREDAVFEVASIVMNTAFWYMKHAVLVAVKPEVSQEIHIIFISLYESNTIYFCLSLSIP